MNLKKTLLFFLSFSFFLSIGFYLYYRYKYPAPYDGSYLFELYPKDLIIKKGNLLILPKERIQHFKNFPPQKDKNAIRIGAFGDSYIYGEETDKTESYPYQLQMMLSKKFPHKKIEVLNFGISGDSFQGQFFLWSAYRKKYQLDYILLGPRGFYINRDNTFKMNWEMTYLGYPKNRFVLGKDGDSIKEVSINANSAETVEGVLKKRYRNYYRLIPSWTALRYDEKPFQIWEFLIPFLKGKLINPFYYTKIPTRREISKINILLLDKIRKEYDKKILFFTNYNHIFKDYKSVKDKYNLNKFPAVKERFYYRFTHDSSLGNEYIAKIYFNALIGKKSFSLKRITCFFSEKEEPGEKPAPFDLSLAKSISVIERNNILSILNKNTHFNTDNNDSSYSKIKSVRHFISFFSKSGFLASPFLPVTFPLKDSEKVYLKLKSGKSLELGEIKALDSHHKFFILYADYIDAVTIPPSHHWWNTYFKVEDLPLKLKKELEGLSAPIELFIGKHKIGRLYPGRLPFDKKVKVFYFFSKEKYERSFIMMGAGSNFVREKNFKDEFSPYMLYLLEDGRRIRSSLPGWKCKKETDPIKLELTNFQALKLKI